MIEEEEVLPAEEVSSAGVKRPTLEASTQLHEKFDLAQVEQDLFNFFSEVSGKIPDWVPVVPSFLKAKKMQWEAMSLLRGKNLATGEQVTNKPEALKLFVEKTLSGFWEEGKTVIDLLLIFGTGGSGNVALGAERVVAQKMAGSVGRSTFEGLGAQIAKLAAGGEGAAIDLLPGFFKGLAGKLAKHPEQAKHLLEMSKVFEKLLKIPGARPLMQELLAQQEWWQKFKTEIKSVHGRAEYGQRVNNAVRNSGFTMPIPA